MRVFQLIPLLVMTLILAACTTFGNLGIVTKSSADPSSILKSGRAFKELGSSQGNACRYFLIALIPFGDSAFSSAVDDALSKSGGDALVNVSVSSSLYGFIFPYNIFSYTCTTVRGTAIKFE